MGNKRQDLVAVFDNAIQIGLPFVFVEVEAEGIQEVISIPQRSMEAKKEFYQNAYSEDLVHVMNSKVRITSVTAGDAEDLADYE